MTKQTKISGWLLIMTGIIHNSLGVVFGHSTLAEIGRAGFFNAVHPPLWQREAIFWFLAAGFAMMMWGMLILALERVPSSFGWSLFAFTVVGVCVMPVSGFWLVLPQAVYMLRHRPVAKGREATLVPTKA